MNLSMKWLSDYVKIEASPKEFAEAMTMTGSKVEGYEVIGEDISRVVVGKIISVEKHPDADKLVICSVDVGESAPVQIVTGASNVFAGALVPVALDNSTLPGGIIIKKGMLRGIESCGMLCSLGELKLTKNDFPYAVEDGIFIIEEPCVPGQDIKEAIGLNDVVVEFEITPNRPDCLSVIGLAREVAATFGKKGTLPVPVVRGGEGKTGDYIAAKVHEPSLCYRYSARAVKNVKIGPSPRWLRERLRAAGVRPINNIVDITNFVMIEYGQPMHAFDYRFISGGIINVRRAVSGEEIITLDGVTRKLDSEILVIADDTKPVAIAGVMGGEHSGIMSDTNTIIFESAMFNGTNVRITSRKLALRTESSGRYEKGLDAQGTLTALERACELVELLGAGEVCGDYIDINSTSFVPTAVKLDPRWINAFLGTNISREFMIKALESIDFKLNQDVITVPSFRADVTHKVDISEEVARIYGYNNIPVSLKLGDTTQGGLSKKQKFEKKLSNILLALGASEISTYSFISPKYYDKIRMPETSPLRKSVTIINPLGEDTSIMRTTMLPSMLEVLARNYSNRNMQACFYEAGTIYLPTSEHELPFEKSQLILGMYGEGFDYYTLKGVVEELLSQLGIADYDLEAFSLAPAYHQGRCAVITIGGKTAAIVGEIHPAVQENYGIDLRVYAAEIDIEMLYNNSQQERKYHPLPKFPATSRDIAIICDEGMPVLELEKAIKSAAKNLIEDIKLFDVYKGAQIQAGKKSAAFSITMRVQDRTLTDDEADAAMKKIIISLESIGAVLRA